MVRGYMLSILVKNNSGVLMRVCSLFSRRGFNINSLSVGETSDPDTSRITVEVDGDEYVLDQIKKQLSKLIEVIKIKELNMKSAILRELILVKIKADRKTRAEFIEICNVFGTKIVDLQPDSLTIELSGRPEKNSAFLELIDPKHIIEMVRTGVSGITRGTGNINE